MADKPALENRYKRLIEKIFLDGYTREQREVNFERADIEAAAAALGVSLPKNIGDIIYSMRYRTPMPETVLATQPAGMEWIIEGTGRATYCFKLVKINRIAPNPNLVTIKIPDATPEIVAQYALSDEQALLAKIRYNRLIDLFLGLTTYSLQNHLRTTVKGIGQIEIDEIYIGLNRDGCHFIIPVQAKGGADQLSVVQTRQDILCCQEKYPALLCRAISAQFIENNLVALLELAVQEDEVKLVHEKHYRLVSGDSISDADLKQYRMLPLE